MNNMEQQTPGKKTLPQRLKGKMKEWRFWYLRTRLFCSPKFLRKHFGKAHSCKTLFSYPDKPKSYHVLYEICKHLGWKITSNPNKCADVAIFFRDTTLREKDTLIEEYAKKHEVLNIESTDISKQHIDTIFEEVFGYAMSIDPETYQGVCVRKSDVNAVHDGTLLKCPTPKETGYVYQKFVNGDLGTGQVMDMRIHIFKDAIPFLLKRYKNKDDMFHMTVGAEPAETDELLSKDEQEKILQYCKKLGIDYGELDALRDNEDGRLYIVDANNTPAGPIGPIFFDKEKYAVWIEQISKAFEKHIL